MRPADLALQIVPPEFTAADALPPAAVLVILIAGLALRWGKQQSDSRDKADASTWKRMRELNEALIGQRDAALDQVEQRDLLIRQQAAHIGDLEQRIDGLRKDLRQALKQIPHQREEQP